MLRMRKLARELLSLLIGATCACGANNNAANPDAGCVTTQCTGAGQPVELGGRFGVLVQLFVDVQAAGGAINQAGLESDQLLLADLTPQTTSVALSAQICDLVLPPVPVSGQRPVTFQLEPALLASLGSLEGALTLGGTSRCAPVSQPSPLTILLGAKLSAPSVALPTFDAQNGTYAACGGTLVSCAAAAPPPS